jgi:hypothetical protein
MLPATTVTFDDANNYNQEEIQIQRKRVFSFNNETQDGVRRSPQLGN